MQNNRPFLPGRIWNNKPSCLGKKITVLCFATLKNIHLGFHWIKLFKNNNNKKNFLKYNHATWFVLTIVKININEEHGSIFSPFFCALILLSRSKQLSFTLLTWPAAWKPRGAKKIECDFKGETLGGRKKRNTQVPFLQIKRDAREHSALVTAEVCVESGEFCLYSFLLVTTVLNNRAITEMKTSMLSGAVWDDREHPACCWSRRTQDFQGQKPPLLASNECFRHPWWSPAAPCPCTKVTKLSFWALGTATDTWTYDTYKLMSACLWLPGLFSSPSQLSWMT